jgi:SH3-like domain-containing protein
LPAWPAPDPARQIVATLNAGLEIAVAERAGDWARVVAVNGWTGWVDARRLVATG